MTESSSRASSSNGKGGRPMAVIAAVIVVVVVLATGFIPVIAAQRETPVGYTTSSLIVNPYTAVETTQIAYPVTSITTSLQTSIQTVQAQPYNINAYTLNCNTYTYLSSQLSQGWNLVVSYSAGDTITVYLFNSAQFTSFQKGNNPTPVASQSGQTTGQLGYIVPLTDTYYLVFDNNLHNGLLCVGGEKVTINSGTGTVTYTTNVVTTQTQTETSIAYSTSTTTITLQSTSTSYYNATSTTTTTKTVGWICDILHC